MEEQLVQRPLSLSANQDSVHKQQRSPGNEKGDSGKQAQFSQNHTTSSHMQAPPVKTPRVDEFQEALHVLLPLMTVEKLAPVLARVRPDVTEAVGRKWGDSIPVMDVLSETEVRLLERAAQGTVAFTGMRPLTTWVTSAALRVASEFYRQEPPGTVDVELIADTTPSAEPSAEEKLIWQEEEAQLQDLVAAIPPKDLAIIKAYQETRDPALCYRAFRARRRVRKLLLARFGIKSLRNLFER